MIHWCADETAALLSMLGGLRVAWVWAKSRLTRWRARRVELAQYHREGRAAAIALRLAKRVRGTVYVAPRPPTEMEQALKALKGKP